MNWYDISISKWLITYFSPLSPRCRSRRRALIEVHEPLGLIKIYSAATLHYQNTNLSTKIWLSSRDDEMYDRSTKNTVYVRKTKYCRDYFFILHHPTKNAFQLQSRANTFNLRVSKLVSKVLKNIQREVI